MSAVSGDKFGDVSSVERGQDKLGSHDMKCAITLGSDDGSDDESERGLSCSHDVGRYGEVSNKACTIQQKLRNVGDLARS